MKKFIYICAAALLTAALLTGCGSEPAETEPETKPVVMCTIFPQYDWAREIIGDTDGVELSLLLSSGVDMHSYQPSAADIVKLSSCNMLVYVGGESDAWVTDVIKNAGNSDMLVLNLMDILSDNIVEEEIIDGMEAEAECEDEDESGVEYDEHIWLSLRNAETICHAIASGLSELDSANADTYSENAESYIKSLDALDCEYKTAVDNARLDTLVFADRFPFRYLTDDYDIDYYAAFPGCSAETEASFNTVIFLAERADELDVPALCIIDGSDGRLAETVADNMYNSVSVVTFDSMQSVTADEIKGGATYVGIMRDNLTTLKTALGE